MAKTYSLVIVYKENSDEVEFIEEEITEDRPSVMYRLGEEIESYDDETLQQLLLNGYIVGES